MDREIHLGSAGEVLDVTVTAVFRATLEIFSVIGIRLEASQSLLTGIVLAPSLPTFALISSAALPA